MPSLVTLPAPSKERPSPAGARPCVERLVVPLDGSPFAERALPVAAWLAGELGAALHLIEVVPRPGAAPAAMRYLDGQARRHRAPSWSVAAADDPVAAIVTAAEAALPSMACLATQGADRRGAPIGTMAAGLLARLSQPVMLVGPRARPPCAGDAPVIAAVEGRRRDRAVLDVAAAWAACLARPLVVTTLPGRAAAADQVDTYGGLTRAVDRTAALLVLGHRGEYPPARGLRDVEVPAVAVPLAAEIVAITTRR